MYKFTICEENDIPWTQIESCSDSNIFHTRDWMKFLIVCKGLRSCFEMIEKNCYRMV